MHLVLVDWSPSSFKSTDQLIDVDYIVGGQVGGRRRVGRWTRRIEVGDGLARDIKRSGRKMSVGHWILVEMIIWWRDDQASHFIGRDGSRQIGFLDLGPLRMVTCDCDQIESQYPIGRSRGTWLLYTH